MREPLNTKKLLKVPEIPRYLGLTTSHKYSGTVVNTIPVQTPDKNLAIYRTSEVLASIIMVHDKNGITLRYN